MAVTLGLALHQQFTIHGDVLKQVEVYKNLGQMMAQDDNNAQASMPNFGRPALLGLGLDKSFGTRIRLRSSLRSSTKLLLDFP